MEEIFTIGHSTHKLEDFIKLLQKNNIDVIVDVRSIPYSKYAYWFNKEDLQFYLKKNKIYYIFMGNSLGARWEDKNLIFEDGKVNFEKVMQTKKFQDGIDRILNGVKKGYKIALMCSEKEAFDCHRFSLISRFLRNKFNIYHIYPDKILSQAYLEKKLLEKYIKFLPEKNLFHPEISDEERLQKAYKLRNIDIAYNIFTKEGDNE
ncbi:hypothetical protein C3L23_03330 [Nautilia sp. PV-1]|uniref:DUF488 domain-containing protein n=1 Tax=Nautilia sp. PV-1 TaxID=2579250 RepID=UPI000FDCA4DA|nr:DUF488 domain-containing protein [Nautilia sp. PV-1]AZV46335.1 hypothetical protein C3L23_03330 [Nautilia sp. PV-1]